MDRKNKDSTNLDINHKPIKETVSDSSEYFEKESFNNEELDIDYTIEHEIKKNLSTDRIYQDVNHDNLTRIQSSNILSEDLYIDTDPVKRSNMAIKRHAASEPVISEVTRQGSSVELKISKKGISESPRIDKRLSNLKELFVKNPLVESNGSLLELDKNNIFITNLVNECFVIQQDTLEKIEKRVDVMLDTITINNRSNMKRLIFVTIGGLILNVTLFCINFFK